MSNIKRDIPRLQPLQSLPRAQNNAEPTSLQPEAALPQDQNVVSRPRTGKPPAIAPVLLSQDQIQTQFPHPEKLNQLAEFLQQQPGHTQHLKSLKGGEQFIQTLLQAQSRRLSEAEIKQLQSFLVSERGANIRYQGHATGIDGNYGKRTHHAVLNALSQKTVSPSPHQLSTPWQAPQQAKASPTDFAKTLNSSHFARLDQRDPILGGLLKKAQSHNLSRTEIESLQSRLRQQGHDLSYNGHATGIDGKFGSRSQSALSQTLQNLLSQATAVSPQKAPQTEPSTPNPPATEDKPMHPSATLFQRIEQSQDLQTKARIIQALPASVQDRLAEIKLNGTNLNDVLKQAATQRLNRSQIMQLQDLLIAGGQKINYPGHATGVDGDFGGRSQQAVNNLIKAALTGQAVAPVKSGPFPHYEKMLADNLLDMTVAIGYDESYGGGWHRPEERESFRALQERGFSRDDNRARELLNQAGHKIEADYTAFYVKENVSEHQGKPVHAIVRLIHAEDGSSGAQKRNAAIEAMNQSDAFAYGGHARFGTGPDFDANFKVTVDWSGVKDAPAQGKATYQGYAMLKQLLGNNDAQAIQRYNQLKAEGRITLEAQNDGNIRMSEKDLHSYELGSQMQNEALQGVDNRLSEEIQTDKYRLWMFNGCRTEDYVQPIRNEGRENAQLNSQNLDLVTTQQPLSWSYVTPSLMAFLDGVMAQDGTPDLLQRLQNANPDKQNSTHAMRGFENNPRTQP